MITPSTQVALNILKDIAYGELSPECQHPVPQPNTLPAVLSQLEVHGLITLSAHQPPESLRSYTLARSASSITLLDVLNAIGEHLDCSHEVDEQFYEHQGTAARKLGVVNTVTRICLSEIRLTDLV